MSVNWVGASHAAAALNTLGWRSMRVRAPLPDLLKPSTQRCGISPDPGKLSPNGTRSLTMKLSSQRVTSVAWSPYQGSMRNEGAISVTLKRLWTLRSRSSSSPSLYCRRPARHAGLDRQHVQVAVQLAGGRVGRLQDAHDRGLRALEDRRHRVALDAVGVDGRRAHEHRGRLPHRRPGVRMDADHGAAEGDWVGGRAQILAAQGAALAGRIGARAEPLADVHEGVARPVAGAGVESAVGTEGKAADGLTWIALEPVLDQDLLGADHHVAARLQAREASADHALLGIRRRAAVPPRRRRAADGCIAGVEHVDVGQGREPGVEGEPQQPAGAVVVHAGPQVGEDRGRRSGHAGEDLDEPALLGHEDPPVGGELEDGRLDEPGEDERLLEAGVGRERPHHRWAERIAGQIGGGAQRRRVRLSGLQVDRGIEGDGPRRRRCSSARRRRPRWRRREGRRRSRPAAPARRRRRSR